MGRLFGTDGVRGVANTELSVELAMKIGKAAAHVLTKETMHKPKILIGKDTRISGDMLESALAAGLCSFGAEVVSLGVIPTPAVAYLTRKYEADAGIVISASHNSAEFNGIKIFNGNGYKLSDAIEDEIEKLIHEDFAGVDVPTGDAVGTISQCDTTLEDYKAFVKETMQGETLEGMKIAIDCANGASYLSSVETLVELGAEIFVVHNHPNGININADCGSTHTDKFCEYVKNIDVDLGLTFDGDADRLLVVDENGQLIDGDKIMLICADYMKEHKMLAKDTLVTTVMTNLGLVNAAKEKGIRIVQTKVGDRYVLEEMLKNGYTLGGEQSGHIICLEYNTTGDGLCSALLLLYILRKTGEKLSKLSSVFTPLPQVILNAKVSNSKKELYTEDAVIMDAIHQVEEEFSGNGRVLIRPSGTEPCVRVMIEGPEQGIVAQKAKYLAKLIEARLV